MVIIKFPEGVRIRVIEGEIYRVIDPRGGHEDFEDCDEANEEALTLVDEIKAVREAIINGDKV